MLKVFNIVGSESDHRKYSISCHFRRWWKRALVGVAFWWPFSSEGSLSRSRRKYRPVLANDRAVLEMSSIDPGSTSSTSAFTDIPFNLSDCADFISFRNQKLVPTGRIGRCFDLLLLAIETSEILYKLVNKKGVIVTSKVPETGLTLEPTSDAIPNRDEVQEVENKEAENVLPDNQEIDLVGSTNEEDALDPEKMRLEEAATKAQAAFRGYLDFCCHFSLKTLYGRHLGPPLLIVDVELNLKVLLLLYFISQLLHRKYSGNFFVDLLGKWKESEYGGGQSVPVGGIAYYITAPSR
ncbi:Protein transport protein [Vigna angularis]|uniref:Protein transport protein n=1 Tax=Phaseolus angularis TaxID=3914 RepID=A0A8T0JQN5_PHAAN|nr:Protein transport protein [Vigna angularis]